VKWRLIPREEAFFESFVKTATEIRHAATLFQEMVAPDEPLWDRASQINDVEHRCDELTRDVLLRLHRTFVTPIDREDIYSLATAIDDVCDFMDQVADELNLYGVEEVPQEAIQQAGVIFRAVSKLSDAIEGLDGLKNIHHHLVDIHTLEDEGDRIVRSATAKLFSNGLDPLVVIRWKDIHHDLEMAVDKCETAAHVLESIYLKNR